MLKADVIIVGAGMVGASCALSLAQNSSLSIVMLDNSAFVDGPVELQQSNIRVSALGQASVALLTQVGVWQKLPDEYRFPYQRMRIWDEMNDAELEFDAAEVGSQQLGYIVDNQALVCALQHAIAKQNNIQTFYTESPTELIQNEEGIVLSLASGKQVQGNLLVAADGANSWVRQTLNISTKAFEYQQQAIVAKMETEAPHQATAWQRFLSSGPLALLPIFDAGKLDNQGSIVWSLQTAEADKLMALSEADFARELQYAFENRFGKVQLLSKRLSFPLQSNIASRYIEGAVVLIGDAAHRIHPMAGQGVNLGFKDVAALQQEVLSAHKENRNIASRKILRRYERNRKLDNQLTDKAMTSLYRLFGSQYPGFAMLRGLGMKVFNRSGMVKNRLVRQAMGI